MTTAVAFSRQNDAGSSKRTTSVLRKFRPLRRPRLSTIYKKKIRKMRLESTWNTTFSVVPAEKFPERSNGTFEKVVLERPKKNCSKRVTFLQNHLLSSLIPVYSFAAGFQGNGTDLYKW